MVGRRGLLGAALFLLAPLGTEIEFKHALAAQLLGDQPRVVAKAFGEMPADVTLMVRYDKKTELNIWIRTTLITHLISQGYTIEEEAPWVLSFRSELRSDTDDGTRFTLEATKNLDRHNSVILDYKVPLGDRQGKASSTYFAVTATLRKAGERAIWQGTSSARTRHKRSLELQPPVVTALAGALGKTVGQESFY